MKPVKETIYRFSRGIILVLIRSMMAVVHRKIIILDVKSMDPLLLIGMASITISLAVGYCFVKKATQIR